MTNAANEITIPILPSCSLAETLAFYQAFGFEVTYQQKSPNTYAVVRRGGIELHFFVLKGLLPKDNYGTCYIVVTDIDSLYASVTEGVRRLLGKVPVRGIPRLNPLKDMPFYGVRQFVVVDPSGNYIRIGQRIPANQLPESENNLVGKAKTQSPLERAFETGSRLADGKGDFVAAANVLDKALSANDPTEPVLRFRVLVLRADVAIQLEDRELARQLLTEAQALPLTDADQVQLGDEQRRIQELQAEIKLF